MTQNEIKVLYHLAEAEEAMKAVHAETTPLTNQHQRAKELVEYSQNIRAEFERWFT